MIGICLLLSTFTAAETKAASVDYSREIKPLFAKYCVGCHEGKEAEGKLSLASHADLLKGGEHGPAIVAGDGENSRLAGMLTGKLEPRMPPEDNEAPSADEIGLIIRWIQQGAKGPVGTEELPTHLDVPKITPVADVLPTINAIAYSPTDDTYALGRFGVAEIHDAKSGKLLHRLADHPGKVTSVRYSNDGRRLVTASGIAGLYGEARLYDTKSGEVIRKLRGHRDLVYAAVLSPIAPILATGSYDRAIILWNTETGEQIRTLDGHNDAVYALAFSPDGTILGSASGDTTVKLWRVADGIRLDTLSQPLQEQYTVAFSPDGRYVVAGGVDNRIRVWQLLSKTEPKINPILYARFGHDQAIVDLKFTPDGGKLVSVSEDRSIKVWETQTFTEIDVFAQPALVSGVALSADGKRFLAGRVDGSVEPFLFEAATSKQAVSQTPASSAHSGDTVVTETAVAKVAEQEPNNTPESATALAVPGEAEGIIAASVDEKTDVDLYRFQAKAGERIVLQTNAARNKSPLDTKIEVLDTAGQNVLRLHLQAVRDSYITFRGIDSTSPDVRCFNWEEMQLNQYLYFQGEVCKISRMPRGPDSGFSLYPEAGARFGYFDTSATTHAVHEPCYVVEPVAPGTTVIPNGLPVFPIYYQNDDDSDRKLGKDSELLFTAPADGEYLVRVTDVRGFGGDDYKYTLTARSAQPGFNITVQGANPVVNAGSGKAFSFDVDRMDGFDGEIRIDITNVPRGFHVTTPIVVQAGHIKAWGSVYAAADAVNVEPAAASGTVITASAVIDGKEINKTIGNLGTLRVAESPQAYVSLTPYGHAAPVVPGRNWSPLSIDEAHAEMGSTLTVKTDGVVLAGGNNPDTESYRIVARKVTGPITAVRLDVLGDSSLPAQSPGRSEDNGNFALTEFRLAVATDNELTNLRPIEISGVGADYAQKDWSEQGLIDGNQNTGWAIAEEEEGKFPVKRNGEDPSHRAIFELKSPVNLAENEQLVVVLDQKSQVKGHNLGKFRLSVTGELPTLNFQPATIEISSGQTIEATLRVDRRAFEGRIGFDDRNLPHGVIVDNIGLNGVLITEDKAERTIYLTAYDWVPSTQMLFYLQSKEADGQCTWPVVLRVTSQKR